MGREKKQVSMKEASPDQILRNIMEENDMFDDHGPVILGGRDKKPVLPKPKREED